MRTRLTAVLEVTAAVLLGVMYASHLADVPIYLAHDEVKFALQAQSIAATGRDINGVFMPLYFAEPEYTAGRDPVSIYATAVVLQFLPLSESAVRLPTALVGLLDVVLMFFLARRLIGSELLAVVAAGLLAFTPAHFIHSRLALDVVYPLPFVMAWLLCLSRFVERPRLATLAAGMLLLGVGVYSYLACMLMMPLYFLFTCLVLGLMRQPRTTYLVAAAAFALPWVPLVLWHIGHPTRYTDLVAAYRLFDSSQSGALRGATQLLGYSQVSDRLAVYWNFFNPSYLFLTGDSSLINSTRGVGVFLLPLAALIPLGIYRIVTARRTPMTVLLLLGFFSAPLAAVLMSEIEIRRALVIVPFAILIATFGIELLLTAQPAVARVAAVALLLLVPLQFRGFYVDYVGAYRTGSSVWFGGNLRGALLEIIGANQDASSAVYLNKRIPYVDAYWQFYSLASGRQDLQQRTVYFEPAGFDERAVPTGTFLADRVGDSGPETRLNAQEWRALRPPTEPDGRVMFVVSQKQ